MHDKEKGEKWFSKYEKAQADGINLRIKFNVVRTERLELSHLAAPEPKPGVSTNFTTSALKKLFPKLGRTLPKFLILFNKIFFLKCSTGKAERIVP